MADIATKNKTFKHTAVIGGAQVVQILAGIIRAKFVAILLGPIGIGINGILNSAIGIITQVSGLGLNFSAVREISQDVTNESPEKLSRTITVIKRWLYFTSLLGAIVTVALSYYLSYLSFDNDKYVMAFVVLSVAVGLNVLNNGNMSVLQGLHKIKMLAYTSLLGSVIGLFTSVPLYYFYGIESIPYAIIVAAATAYVVSSVMVKRLKIPSTPMSLPEVFHKGKDMAALGVVLMLAQVIGLIVIYVINAYITHSASLVDLGFYQAGIGITTQYSSLVFTAMATEYFPRLSGVCKDVKKTNLAINQQIEISLLIITPIVLLVVITAPIIIKVLLSAEFIHIQRFVELMAMSMILKGAAFPIGYLSFARGDKRIFFLLEGVGGSSLILIAGIVGFYIGGLNGIAYFTIAINVLYLFVIAIVTRVRYGYIINRSALTMMILSIFISSCVVALLHVYNVYTVTIAAVVVAVSLIWYIYEISKVINIVAFLRSKISK